MKKEVILKRVWFDVHACGNGCDARKMRLNRGLALRSEPPTNWVYEPMRL